MRQLTAILLVLLIGITTLQGALTERGRRLFTDCEQALSLRRYDELQQTGTTLQRLGAAAANGEEEAAGEAFVINSLIQRRDTTDLSARIAHLKTMTDRGDLSSPEILTFINRTISLYYQFIEADYARASSYAFKALEQARAARLPAAEVYALSSIASIYFQKQDSTGFSYACRAYDMARRHDISLAMYVASLNMANYMYNRGETARALEYLNEGAGYARRYDMKSEEVYLNSFMGDIYERMGDNGRAEQYHLKALRSNGHEPVYDRIYAHLCYAIFLERQQRWREAMDILLTTRRMTDSTKVTVFRNMIYQNLSLSAEGMHDWRKALEYHKAYMEAQLDLLNEAKEKEFAILDLRYRVAEEKNKNAEQQLELMHRRRITTLLLGVAILLVAAVAALVVYQSRRTRHYKRVIERYLENTRSEAELRSRLERALAELKNMPSKTTGSLNEEKAAELFARLERLMRDDHIYRDSGLSLTSTATMLATNRTYLSQVVNTKAGKSFAAYVNEYRLNESVELLMDPTNGDSLKSIGAYVGFSSPSNFYSLFKLKVGVSPSVFRSNCRSVSD